jgi:hypothetical protein
MVEPFLFLQVLSGFSGTFDYFRALNNFSGTASGARRLGNIIGHSVWLSAEAVYPSSRLGI